MVTRDSREPRDSYNQLTVLVLPLPRLPSSQDRPLGEHFDMVAASMAVGSDGAMLRPLFLTRYSECK